MAKTYLGIDVGCDSLKMALVSNGQVRKAVAVEMPKNLVQQGRVVSEETMGELIKHTMREYGIRANSAAYVMPLDTVFIKNVTMPQMSAEQLQYNLPYEFHDYISEDLTNYIFDYAMISSPAELAEAAAKNGEEAEGEEENASMELLGVGVSKAALEEIRTFLQKAGLKLEKAAPPMCCYSSLIRAADPEAAAARQEYCVIDMGYEAIRMYMFRGDRHIVTRTVEIGLSSLDDVAGDIFGVDVHLAHNYLLRNYEDCQRSDECMNAYDNIAVELTRALNFYRFSNPDSQLNDAWICGGGALIDPLRETISDSLDMIIHEPNELVPGSNVPDCSLFLQAIGIAFD